MKPIVLCDIDGVLADTMTPMRSWLFARHGLTVPELTEYNPYINGTCLQEWFNQAMQEPEFIASALPMTDGRAMLDNLSEAFEVRFATARPAAAYQPTVAWLEQHLGLVKPRVYLASGNSKVHLAGISRVLIDDAPGQIESWCDAGNLGILVSRKYNLAWADERLVPGVRWRRLSSPEIAVSMVRWLMDLYPEEGE